MLILQKNLILSILIIYIYDMKFKTNQMELVWIGLVFGPSDNMTWFLK